MAKKKRGRFTFFLFFVFGVFLIWSVAFLAWLFWSDMESLVRGKKTSSEQSRKPSQEKIFEEDRKKLEEILKGK
ncbi:MAG: hypothetical protein ACREP8_17100 [Candidatus Binatia bacterium]